MMMPQYRLLFVCSGNICRSPTANGIMRDLSQSYQYIKCDSAAIYNYHIGQPPDKRAIKTANHYNIDIASLRARQVTQHDFNNFTHIFAMGYNHLNHLERLKPCRHHAQILLFHHATKGARYNQEVLDPYYGDKQNFDDAFHDIMVGCKAILNILMNNADI